MGGSTNDATYDTGRTATRETAEKSTRPAMVGTTGAPAAVEGNVSAPGVSNQQIMRAIELLNRMPSALRRQVAEAREGGEQNRAQRSEAWISGHEAEVRERAMGLVRNVIAGGHPQPSAELRALMQPMDLPPELFTETDVEAEACDGNVPAVAAQNEANRDGDRKKKREHDFSGNCGSVVLGDAGHYVELKCDKCGGNSGRSTKKYLSGIRGFSKHYQAAHKETLSPAKILSRCFVRRVEMDEVREIESGTVKNVQKVPVAANEGN